MSTAMNAANAQEQSNAEVHQMDAIPQSEKLAVAKVAKKPQPSQASQPRCSACTYQHGSCCPAAKAKCHMCRKIGHFSCACTNTDQQKRVKAVETPANGESAEAIAKMDMLRIYDIRSSVVSELHEGRSEESVWYVTWLFE